MSKRTVSILTLALLAGAVSTFPLLARADAPQPTVQAPPGWTSREGRAGSHYFLPPGATNMNVYEAIFPTQALSGSLEATASAVWHNVIGNERLVDTQAKTLDVDDGTPVYEVIVATIDSHNQGVYRVFIFKQYGQTVAAGELHFNDVDLMATLGKPAIASLMNMSK